MRLVEQFIRVLAPSQCLNCADEGSLLCSWCVDDALPEADSRCYSCNKLTKNFAVCVNCHRKTTLSHIFTRTDYSGLAKELVHKMKFNYSTEAADIIAESLVSKLPALSPNTILVYLPTVTDHVRQRGFDHTKRIATALSRELGVEIVPALARINKARQVGSRRSDRLKQQTAAFRIKKTHLVGSKHVILVDDVITTGGTLSSAAQMLKNAGAKSVDAVVFAKSTL